MAMRLCRPMPKQPADRRANGSGHDKADDHLKRESDHGAFGSIMRSSIRRFRCKAAREIPAASG
jgi:hypothetical protein